MTFIECLKNDFFSFPKFIERNSFEDYLKNQFEQYQFLILQISEPLIKNEVDKHKAEIVSCCDLFLNSIKAKAKGLENKSYQYFVKALQILTPFLIQSTIYDNKTNNNLEIPFYRIRIGNNYPYSKKEIFHIPFDKRKLASTQRFSVSGYPCLYLSNSIYTCWEEMNRPSINNFQVSRFQKENNNMRILDLTLTRNRLRIQLESFASSRLDTESIYHKISIAFILLWPLFLICSLSTKNKTVHFNQEYIFPQYLLNWIIETENYDAIKYFSTKCNPLSLYDYSTFINYVFPTKNSDNNGYCSFLSKSFKISEPISYELLLLSNPDFIFNPNIVYKKPLYQLSTSFYQLRFINGVVINNDISLFSRMERFFEFIEVDYLK